MLEKYGADALRLYLINSPVLRAETLKFKERRGQGNCFQCVVAMVQLLQVLKDAADLFKKDNGKDFVYDSSLHSTNVMDRWLLASINL